MSKNKNRNKKFKYVFAIIGKTDINCRRNLYFINSPTQNFSMCEFAWSLATEFETKAQANSYIPKLKEKYKGIKQFKLEYRKIELI
jgi:hypothetical protein